MDKFEVKVGDQVIVKSSDGFSIGHKITTVKSITPKRRDIMLENGMKFPKGNYWTNDGQKWSRTSYELLEHNDENLKEIDKHNHIVSTRRNVRNFIDSYQKGTIKPNQEEMEELSKLMYKINSGIKGECE